MLLHQHIFAACETIRNRPGIFERVYNLTRPCIKLDGKYFEHLL